jgi:hypothetical protein
MELETVTLRYRWEGHDPQSQPPTRELRLWRYMSIEKLIMTLDRGALYFSALRNLADKWEGGLWELPQTASAHARIYSDGSRKAMRQHVFVSCWNASKHESAAMWHLYAPNGLAIQSTVDLVGKSFDNAYQRTETVSGRSQQRCRERDEIVGLAVKYRRPKRQRRLKKWFDVYDEAKCKRPCFRHEEEVRFCYSDMRKTTSPGSVPPAGIWVKVDLKQMIERIVVAPDAGRIVHDAVTALLRKYELKDIPVGGSETGISPAMHLRP